MYVITGMPRILRSDCGTENCNLAFIQPFLRRNHDDVFSEMESFRYGRSSANQVKSCYHCVIVIVVVMNVPYTCMQRIESWWSQLGRKFTQWWRSFFLVCIIIYVSTLLTMAKIVVYGGFWSL